MSRIVTALFKDRAQAQQALQSLIEMGIAQTRVTTLGMHEGREVSSISGFRTLDLPDESRTALQGLGLPSDDRAVFEQGVRRGCSLIAVRVDRDDFDGAVRVLEMFEPVDLDQESREWAKDKPGQEGGADVGGPLGAGITAGSTAGMTNTGTLPGMGLMAQGADDLGTTDLRTDEVAQANQGSSTTTGTGSRRSDERADREGVNELTGSGPTPVQAGLLQRQLHRGGKLWVFGSTEGDVL